MKEIAQLQRIATDLHNLASELDLVFEDFDSETLQQEKPYLFACNLVDLSESIDAYALSLQRARSALCFSN